MKGMGIIFAVLLLVTCVSAQYTCKTCDATAITISHKPDLLPSILNVTATLTFFRMPEVKDPAAITDLIREGKVDIEQLSEITVSGPVVGENLTISFIQQVDDKATVIASCRNETNDEGQVNCTLNVGIQGCGMIVASFNGTKKYLAFEMSTPYCIGGRAPFFAFVSPDCFVVMIFFGLLIAGLYAAGKKPLAAFDITTPKGFKGPKVKVDFKKIETSVGNIKRYIVGRGRSMSLAVSTGVALPALLGGKVLYEGTAVGRLRRNKILTKKQAKEIAKAPLEERPSKILLEAKEKMKKVKRVQLVKEKQMKGLEAMITMAAKYRYRYTEKQRKKMGERLKKMKKEHERRRKNIAVYENLLRGQREQISQLAKLLKEKPEVAATYHANLEGLLKMYVTKTMDLAEGVKVQPYDYTENILSGLDSPQNIFIPALRAKLAKEETASTLDYFVHRNRRKLSPDNRALYESLETEEDEKKREEVLLSLAKKIDKKVYSSAKRVLDGSKVISKYMEGVDRGISEIPKAKKDEREDIIRVAQTGILKSYEVSMSVMDNLSDLGKRTTLFSNLIRKDPEAAEFYAKRYINTPLIKKLIKLWW